MVPLVEISRILRMRRDAGDTAAVVDEPAGNAEFIADACFTNCLWLGADDEIGLLINGSVSGAARATSLASKPTRGVGWGEAR